jgi:hypothetical protein
MNRSDTQRCHAEPSRPTGRVPACRLALCCDGQRTGPCRNRMTLIVGEAEAAAELAATGHDVESPGSNAESWK